MPSPKKINSGLHSEEKEIAKISPTNRNEPKNKVSMEKLDTVAINLNNLKLEEKQSTISENSLLKNTDKYYSEEEFEYYKKKYPIDANLDYQSRKFIR